jgi:mono/diheme cytochrome c family protein
MKTNKTFALIASSLALAVCLFGQSAAKKSNGGSGSSSATVTRGKTVYTGYCEICHFDTSDKKKVGPGLKGLTRRGTFSDGAKLDDARLRTWIENGGKDMPSFRTTLSDAQFRDLIAYLKTL